MGLWSMRNKIRSAVDGVVNTTILKLKGAKIGSNTVFHGRIRVYGNGSISMGDNVILRSGSATNPLGGSNQLILFCKHGGSIEIGNRVGISNSCIWSAKSVTIEDDVNIGGDCKIYDSDMHSVEFSERMRVPDNTAKSASVVIKKGAWIGAHSIILKGVTIGERSVIGAGSVVAKDVPNDEVWAGNPARFIRRINNSQPTMNE